MIGVRKKIGIVFHKNPFVSVTGIDQVRLRAMSSSFSKLGFDVEIIATIKNAGTLENGLRVEPVEILEDRCRYDLIKTSYHWSVKYLKKFEGPVVSRIVRVIDYKLPERDEVNRRELLDLQDIIKQRASALIVNNEENRQRWINLYGNFPEVFVIPTGCPAVIPLPGKNPFQTITKNIIFLGSLAAPRMVQMLNLTAHHLQDVAKVHLIGLNKACMYGGDDSCVLDPAIIDHGELPENEIWNYIYHADLGLAFATGPHRFDNDISKILNYLRGGLPVVSESPIINNDLIEQTGFGLIFDFGDIYGLIEASRKVLLGSGKTDRAAVMNFMATKHSWDRRAEVYADIFKKLLV